ncbi:hypothetical protein [Curtobacterium oceanosedimentum]|uniref:hypothetical protein n=1 Tax=Curtobacterium oceanosedimentum TaxID=465820 RepID=UPI0007366229|nr:hypothetical protein [Curtobacterium oceanosedimentum]
MICPLHAWGDESIRSTGWSGPAYLLGASVVDTDDAATTRETLRTLRPTRGKLHWHDLGHRERDRVETAIAALPARHLVVIGMPTDLRREERARAVCLERLGWELAVLGVSVLTFERRAAALDARDLRVVEALRGRRVIPSSLRIEHGDPRCEPLLWLPDQVLGAIGRAVTDARPLPVPLASAVQTFEVEP